jgi:hypothetical protein
MCWRLSGLDLLDRLLMGGTEFLQHQHNHADGHQQLNDGGHEQRHADEIL